jgi:hypothetical protein
MFIRGGGAFTVDWAVHFWRCRAFQASRAKNEGLNRIVAHEVKKDLVVTSGRCGGTNKTDPMIIRLKHLLMMLKSEKTCPRTLFGRGAPKGQADGDPLYLQSAAQSGANPIYLLSDIEATLRTDRVARTSRFLRSPLRSYPAAFGLRGSWNARRCRAFPATLRAVTWAGWQGQPAAQPCRQDSQLRRCLLASAAERCTAHGQYPRGQGE